VKKQRLINPVSGVILPVVLTLLVQALVSMSTVTVPVFMAVLIVCALFGAVAIGWNGVYLAEVARVAKPEFAGMVTGGSLFFTFAGILIGLPAFSLLVEKSGSYPLGFGIIAVATFVCGIVLLLSHNSR
jgi:MFS family permease